MFTTAYQSGADWNESKFSNERFDKLLLEAKGELFNIIHMIAGSPDRRIAGSPVEPNDVPVPIRHLRSAQTTMELSDKVPYVFAHSRQRVWDVLDMLAIVHGLEDRAALANAPRIY